jgi:hypothetical protein
MTTRLYTIAALGAEAQLETEQPMGGQMDEDVGNGDGFTSSDTLEEPDIVHVVRDIVQRQMNLR